MSTEQTIQQRIRLALSRGPVRLWRNNTGALRDQRGQLVTYGLCKGSADLIGYRSITVTPEMVGATIAQFVALEVKAVAGRTTPEQEAFIRLVAEAGGVGAVVRSIDDATKQLGNP